MVDQRRVDTLLIDRALRDADPFRRARAALAIGQLRMTARYSALRKLLVDGDTAIAANAAFALGVAKDSSSRVALARAVSGAPDAVAREAAWSLGEIGEPSRGVITIALGEGSVRPRETSPLAARAPAVRAALLLSTAKLRPVPASLITPWLADSAADVVRAAAYVLGRTRPAAGVRALLDVHQHADEEVRQHVARAMVRPVVGDSLNDAARAALAILMHDSHERVRINATRSLNSFGTAARAQILVLLNDTVPNVRVAAGESLDVILGDDRAAWRGVWARDTVLASRTQFLGLARRAGLDVFVAEEASWASHADWRYRLAALDVMPRTPAVSTTQLVAFLADEDPRVRTAALLRLPEPITDTLARAQASAARTDPDADVRATALRRLGLDSTSRTAAPDRTEAGIAVRPLADYEQLVRRWVVPGARQPVATIETDFGNITVELLAREAPLVVESFVRLAQAGAYRNTTFHRVVPNFVVQDGDVRGDGSGRAAFSLRESFSRRRHDRGCVGLATSGPDTGGSQYYLCHSSQPHLDGGYTVFGALRDGSTVMDRLTQGDRMRRITIQ